MGLIAGIFWILLITNIDKIFAQTRKSSRIISSRSFGLNTKSSSLSGVDFDCPEEFGYYPHPTDCTQYYVCVFGGALLESCTGGLMYSHELQTCDWPRNVGCEVSEINSSPPSSLKEISSRVPQTKQQKQQHVQVSQRVRFSALSSESSQQHQSQTQPPRQQQQQQNRQQQIIQAQIQAIPPPPALRIAPNPVITSRGQPKPISLDSREEIAKLYAEAHDTLPPIEEEETDRQQRVYRGQPSTVSQVQRDRDGIIHQANINAIPNHGKVGSYAFGSQVNQFSYLNNLKTETNRIKRETKNKDITEGTASNNRTVKENVARQPRQIRIHLNGRSSLEHKKNNILHDYRPQSNKFRPSLRKEEFNPFLHSSPTTSNNYYKNGFNGYKSTQPLFFSLSSDSRKLNSPFKPITSQTDYWYKEPFRPTTPPALLFPFLLEGLNNAQSHKKPHADTLPDNFSYFHFGDSPSSVFNTHPKSSAEVNKATTKNHASTAFSTIGGFYNNHEKDSLIIPNSYDKNIKFSQQLNFPEPPLKVTTESNYFVYNIWQNQNMTNFYLTSTIRPTTKAALGYQPFGIHNFYANTVASNFSSPISLNKFNVTFPAKNQSIQQNLNTSDALTVKTTRPLTDTKTIVYKNQTTLPHPLLEPNLDFNKFIKGIAQSQIVQTDPSIMEMLKYFKSSANIVKNDKTVNNSSPSTLSIFLNDFEKQTGSNNYTIGTDNDKSSLNLSRTYSSVQKLTPIKTPKIRLEYIPTSLNYDDSEEYYDDDDDYDINPPSEKPLYMPNSETVAPKPYSTLTTPKYKYTMFTTKKPFPYFHNDSNTDKIPSIINFPPDIFENMKSIFQQNNTSTVRSFDNFLTKFTTQKSILSTIATTTRTIQTGRPNRGHLKWKINKMTSKQNERNRPVQQQLQIGERMNHRVETSSQPGNVFVQQRPSKTATEQNTRNYHNNTNHQQQFRSSPYDSYYSVYDDDVELYRDVEFSSEHQQQRGKSQSSTYRPELVSTQAPLMPGRDTYNKPQTNQQQHEQPSLVYNTDYDDTIISQLEDDDYNQPTRNPLRDDRIEINSIMNRPVLISRTTDESPYTPTHTLSPISYAQIPQSPKSQSPPIQQQKQQQQQQSRQPQRTSQQSKYIQSYPIDQYNVVSTSTPDYPTKQTTPSRSTLSDIGSNNKTSNLISITQSPVAGSSKFEDNNTIHQSINPLPIPTILKELQFQNSQFQNGSNTFMTEKQLLVLTPFTNYTNDKLTSYHKINSTSSPENISISSNNLVSEDNKDKDQIIDRQSERILSYIVSDVQPQSFKLARKRITEKLPSIENNPHKLTNVISNTSQLKSRNGLSHYRAVIEPTTYSPPKTWRLTETSPSPFEALRGNPLKSFRNQNTPLSDNIKNESINEQVLSLESENYATKEKIQSYTTRALVFKDNLNKNFDTTGSPKYVSPYKSLETILQDEHQTTVKPRYTTLPPLTTTPQRPFRSYFLITAPPKNNNISITSTTTHSTTRTTITNSLKLENVSAITTSSSVITTTPTTMSKISIPTSTIYEPNVPSTLSAIADVRRTTTASPSIKSTLKIRTTSAPPTTTKFSNKKDSDNHENTFRGRLKYTFSYTDNSLDEPTTYSPKIRYLSSNYNSISTTPEPIFKRKNVRTRPTAVIFSNSSYNKEKSVLKPEFSALKSQKQVEVFESPRKYFTKTDSSYQLSNENESSNFQNVTSVTVEEVSLILPTTEEIVVEITERPLYRIKKPPEYLMKEKIVDDLVVNITQNQLQENLRILKTSIPVKPVLNLEYDEATKESEYSTELSATTSTEKAQTIAMLDILKSNNTTTITNDISTTTEKTLTTTTGIVIQTVTKSTVSYPKLLLPSRVSRVNNAIKTSIAASSRTKTTTTAISKCADNTPNIKCNEIPSRQSNRHRGGAHYSSSDRDQPATVPVNRGTHPPRIRPTLKPSGTIVSKATEFIDIYRNPALRAEPLYPQPTPDKTAAKCRKDVCLLPDCYCGGKDIPGDLPVENVPQIVLLTFDDSVNDLNKQLYIDLFEKGRVNPNGCPITATFYVSHEWTDYSQVQNLYADGHEMASHTVSHSFGEQFSQKKWTREVAGQREILAAYGGVKLSDVRGMRAPFLSIGGNKMFKMLYDSNFTYDSSMPVYENRPPSWPYTLDYKIFHDCMIPPCPTKSYPGVWEVPMVMWQDLNGGRCSMGDACSNPADAENVYKMIMKNFERHYTTNRAPFGLFYHAAWFTQPHHKEGFISFLDTINTMNDVWIVTNWQALQWVRDPTPLSRINHFQPFQCDYSDRPKRCNNPKVCNLWHKSGVRYMRTCQPCPDIYPWTGKTGIRSSRIDNDIEE